MFKRNLYLNKILPELDNKQDILFLVGARQVGKTSLLKSLIEFNYINEEEALFLNGDKLLELGLSKSMDLEILVFNKIKKEKLKFLIIDEAQYVKNIGLILKIFIDQVRKGDFNFKIIVTGSGSLETFRGITDSLIGRKKIIQVHSLSFLEFLEYKQFDIESIQVISLENKNILNTYLDEFISYGSYPRVVMENSLEKKLDILNNLFNDYIYKDIGFYLKEGEIISFDKFLKYISTGICSSLAVDKIIGDLGISKRLADKFIFLVENTFIINFVPAFFKNKQKEISKAKKIYFSDLGFLRKVLGISFIAGEVRGKFIENFVYTEILKYKSDLENLYYYGKKSQSEIDFILQNEFSGKIFPIEIKIGSKDNIPIIFKSFLEDYREKIGNFYLINNDICKIREVGEKQLKVISYLNLFTEFYK